MVGLCRCGIKQGYEAYHILWKMVDSTLGSYFCLLFSQQYLISLANEAVLTNVRPIYFQEISLVPNGDGTYCAVDRLSYNIRRVVVDGTATQR